MLDKNGRNPSFWGGGMLVYGVCILVVNLVLLKKVNNFTGWCELLILSQIVAFGLVMWFETGNSYFD